MKIQQLPTGWSLKKLEEIISSSRLGGNYENAEANIGIPVIKMGNLDRGRIKLDNIQFLPIETQYNNDDILHEGDLLFNTRNTLELVGKVAVWRNELPKAIFNSNLLKIEFNEQYVYSTYFMNYAFNSNYGIQQLRSFATGTTSVAAIYGRDLSSFQVLLPPLPEQNKIVQILSTWDEAIQTTQSLIKKLEIRKKGLMQRLMNQGKKEKKAGEVFKSFSEKNHPDEPLLSATQDRGVIPRTMLEGRVASPDGSTSGYKLVQKGDFIISLRSFEGGLEYSEYRGIISPAYTILQPKVSIDSDFYKHYFKSERFVRKLGVAVIGIRDGKQISFDDFSVIKIPFPPIEEQTAIAEILNTADAELNETKAYLTALKQQKKGLMQQLLTGKIRVK